MGGKMTKAALEARKKKVLDNIAKGGGHNVTDYQNYLKSLWTDEDDERKRVP
jgi:hypothetical protein